MTAKRRGFPWWEGQSSGFKMRLANGFARKAEESPHTLEVDPWGRLTTTSDLGWTLASLCLDGRRRSPRGTTPPSGERK